MTDALVRGLRNACIVWAACAILAAYFFGSVEIAGLQFGLDLSRLPSDRGIVHDPDAQGGWK